MDYSINHVDMYICRHIYIYVCKLLTPSSGLFFISCNLNTRISINITHKIINISMFICLASIH